jgi:protein disulfide-isomerase
MNRKIVVLGILSRDRTEEFTLARKELKEAAVEFMQQRQEEEQTECKRLRDQKQLRLDEAEERNDDRGIRAAKGTRISTTECQGVGFAWVDGVFWERVVRSTYGVNVNVDGARIIINDEDVGWPSPRSPRSPYSPSYCSSADAGRQRKQYWDLTVNSEYINTSLTAS